MIMSSATIISAEDKIEQKPFEINTVLMQSTFKIEGKNSTGTVFVIGRPHSKNPEMSRFTLVTAAHVLEDIKEDTAVLTMRQKSQDGKWNKISITIQIRDGGKPLWVQHPKADVAAMYIGVPHGILDWPILSTDLLADDDTLNEFEVHPGDKLFSLGFPFTAEANEEGFPILRSGVIASYPLIPSRETKTFLFDFQVFPGNSGGPVYFYDTNRNYKGGMHVGTTIQFIIGLVSQQKLITTETREPFKESKQSYPLGLAQVVHASLIKDTIQLLPAPEPKEH